MSIPSLIIGPSGTGKTTSLRNLDPNKFCLIQAIQKPVPFKSTIKPYVTDDHDKIIKAVKSAPTDIVVIDDIGYTMTNQFMRGHSAKGGGSSQFDFFNDIADKFWRLINAITEMESDKRVYLMMHEQIDQFGNIRPKTIGKLVDEKVCLEGLFAIVLRSAIEDGKHVFQTQSDGFTCAKTPMGMFDTPTIDNDLAIVDKAIVEYYGIKENK